VLRERRGNCLSACRRNPPARSRARCRAAARAAARAENPGQYCGVVTDAAHRLLQARLERGAPLRRVERGARLARPQHVGERARAGEHLLHRLPPGRADQIVRVLAFRQQRELHALARLEPRQRQIDRAEGGAPAGLIAVEAQDRLVRHLPQQRELIFGQCGAERRDRPSPESPP
jgi:hypothetical protein